MSQRRGGRVRFLHKSRLPPFLSSLDRTHPRPSGGPPLVLPLHCLVLYRFPTLPSYLPSTYPPYSSLPLSSTLSLFRPYPFKPIKVILVSSVLPSPFSSPSLRLLTLPDLRSEKGICYTLSRGLVGQRSKRREDTGWVVSRRQVGTPRSSLETRSH